ncbi:MAG: hypothetical protein L0H64_12840 [Pseudonocardia sp.]|nr:hypothetical protein [Pseudonocardia sp.]
MGLALWCVAAVVVALLVGRMIRLRDQRTPRPDRPVTGIPTQRCSSDPIRDDPVRDRDPPEVRGR